MTSIFTKFVFFMYTVWLQTTIYLVCGVLTTAYLLYAWFKGHFDKAKERDVPPTCLQDPALGWHRFVKLKNVKLHYVEAGSADNPLVVMIHGAPDFWFTWRKQIPSLANYYWVVAVDLRGCGDSDTPRLRTQYSVDIIAEDIVHLIGSLGRDKAHLVCAGVGGLVGWHMAQRYPELVSKMVLIHSPHPYIIKQHINSIWSNYLKVWYMFFLQLPLLPEYVALLNDRSVIDRILRPLTRAKAVSEQEVEAYKFTFSRREDWTGALHHLRQSHVTGRGVQEEKQPDLVTVPTLLVMGDSDPILPLDTAYRSAELVERIRIKSVSGQGSFAHVSHAETLNREIDDFLATKPRREISSSSSSSSSSSDESESPSPSFPGRVFGASLAAVSSTYGRFSDAIKTTRGLVHSSLKSAEQSLELEQFY